MKEINRKKLIFLTLCFLYSVFSLSSNVFAEENGGAVQTNGEITFYEETMESTGKTKETSGKQFVEKPKGKLPATGEIVRNSLSVVGVSVLVLWLVLFYRKRRKQKNE